MEAKETKGKETQLSAEIATKVGNKLKGESNRMATKTKQPKATQANKPQTEEKFLTSKELAKMADTTPTNLRKCLRHHFAGKIPRTKGANGRSQYRIRASDPLVKEIIAKAKGNGGKATTVKAKAPKAEAPNVKTVDTSDDKGRRLHAKLISPSTAKVSKKQAKVKPTEKEVDQITQAVARTMDKGEGDEPSPESHLCDHSCRFLDKDNICSKRDQQVELGLSCDLYEPLLHIPEPIKRALARQGKEAK